MAGRLTTPRLYPIMKEELRQVMNVVKIRQNDGAYEKTKTSLVITIVAISTLPTAKDSAIVQVNSSSSID